MIVIKANEIQRTILKLATVTHQKRAIKQGKLNAKRFKRMIGKRVFV